MTTRSRDIQPALGHLEAALEASCASLMALEAASFTNRQPALDVSTVRDEISNAIASVREAISELRALHEVETSMLAFGFVVADPERSRKASPPAPRRAH